MSGTEYVEVAIDREQFGAAWPFTQPRAILRCYAGVWLTAILDGCECAMNAAATQRGFPSDRPFRAGDGRRPSIAKPIEPLIDAVQTAVGLLPHCDASYIARLVADGHAPAPPSDDE